MSTIMRTAKLNGLNPAAYLRDTLVMTTECRVPRPTEPPETPTLSLSADESLVLFDPLSRLIDDEKAAGLIDLVQHDAEIWALNGLHCQLERTVSASFTSAYRSSVEAARSNLLAINGGRWPRRETN
jgi:peptide subunit release factor 1 (eRF1)